MEKYILDTNENTFTLLSVKREIEYIEIKADLVIEMDTIGMRYDGAIGGILQCFHTLIEFYCQQGFPNLATHHILQSIAIFREWNRVCLQVMPALNGRPTVTLNRFQGRRWAISDLSQSMNGALRLINYFIQQVRADGLNIRDIVSNFKALKASFTFLKHNISTFGTLNQVQPDVKFPENAIAMQQDSLNTMIVTYFPNYHKLFFFQRA